MGAVLSIISGAGINANGSGGTVYLFSKLADHGETKRVRPNEAIEKLQKDRYSLVKEDKKDFILLMIDYKEKHVEENV